ncbi:hypothetical protein M9978_03985 [Sphingomonas sp. MG17]|uniref:Uncharacterized protein n=1 Tax=Sphingomonas tagetis TaxID=2949092 RepID=A0A9X2KKB7_9SPHN|nr:hypothetical protein [Sphingomonas tagetis]MCP3729580.1 hypothetical protein [Sphingomonas tagetis]
MSDDKPAARPSLDPRWKNAGIAAAVLLAPGGFILGGLLIARALKKRREAAEDQIQPSKT